MLSCPWRVERVPICEHYESVFLMVRTDESGFEDIRQVHADIRFPEHIAKAVRSRQIEFFAGRLLAKLALETLGSFHTAVPIGNHREPVWPAGFVGSISHSQTIVGVLMLRKTNLLVGIDIEHRIASEQCNFLREVLNNRELTLLNQAGFDEVESVTLGFSVKETLFKAVFPRVKRYLDFNQSTLLGFDQSQNCVDIELHIDGASSRYSVSVVDLGLLLITSLIAPVD